MYIEKSFSNRGRKFYSVMMDEAELSLYSDMVESLYSDEPSTVDREPEVERRKPSKHFKRGLGSMGAAYGGLAGGAAGTLLGGTGLVALKLARRGGPISRGTKIAGLAIPAAALGTLGAITGGVAGSTTGAVIDKTGDAVQQTSDAITERIKNGGKRRR